MTKKKKLAFSRVIDKIKLPEEYHKTKKILNADRKKIRYIYKNSSHTYRTLAKMYGVAYGTIQCIINEETRIKNLIIAKKYRNSPIFKKKKQTMDLRYRKKELVKKGIINL